MNINVDFGQTDGLKDLEISIENGRFDILISNMLADYQKKQLSLPISDVIGKRDFPEDFYSEYPIKVDGIALYKPAKVQGVVVAAEKGAIIGSYTSKSAIFLLMIFAMPTAIALQKIILSLDYLDIIDVKDIPTNIQTMIDIATSGDLFGDFKPFGDFYKFKDGREEISEELVNSGSRILEEIVTSKKLCRPHEIFENNELGCFGWNNIGEYFFVLILLAFLGIFFNVIAWIVFRKEKKPN